MTVVVSKINPIDETSLARDLLLLPATTEAHITPHLGRVCLLQHVIGDHVQLLLVLTRLG